MTSILIHQPEYLPWINLFNKLKQSDIFVFLDNVQYNRRSYQNRNLIKTKNGSEYLTVPIKKQPRETLIKDILINNTVNWQTKHLEKIILNYKNSKFFDIIYIKIKKILDKDFIFLSDLNIELTKTFAKILNIKPKFFKASNFKFSKNKSDLILEICNHFEANNYITGQGSKNYLLEEKFQANGIKINYLDPLPINYIQQFQNLGFMSDLSIIDLLFNDINIFK